MPAFGAVQSRFKSGLPSRKAIVLSERHANIRSLCHIDQDTRDQKLRKLSRSLDHGRTPCDSLTCRLGARTLRRSESGPSSGSSMSLTFRATVPALALRAFLSKSSGRPLLSPVPGQKPCEISGGARREITGSRSRSGQRPGRSARAISTPKPLRLPASRDPLLERSRWKKSWSKDRLFTQFAKAPSLRGRLEAADLRDVRPG